MWTMTPIGFFSTVALKTKPGMVMVRGRERTHLEAFVERYQQVIGIRLPATAILDQPHSDYRWRIIIDKEEMVAVFADLLHDIEYDNFKSECTRRQTGAAGRRYVHALHEVWSVMYGLQTPAGDLDDTLTVYGYNKR